MTSFTELVLAIGGFVNPSNPGFGVELAIGGLVIAYWLYRGVVPFIWSFFSPWLGDFFFKPPETK